MGETDFQVSKITEFAKEHDGESLLASAKSGENVEKMFYTIGDMIVNEAVDWEKEV